MSIYIQLLHGRKTPDEELNGWGPDGPVLGPFDYFHSTYFTNMVFACMDEDKVWNLADSKVEELVHYDGMYYGDFEITSGGGLKCPLDHIEDFDPEKAMLTKKNPKGVSHD